MIPDEAAEPTDDLSRLLLGVHGLERSIERYVQTLDGAGLAVDARASVGEALWWISALDEWQPAKKQAEIHDWVARNRHRQIDETISALRYARNQASHLLAHVIGSAAQEKTAYEIEHPDGSREIFEITMTSSSIVHPSHDRTTRATYQFPHLDGEGEQNLMRDALYEQRVMGRDIDVVLNEAAAYFGALLIVVAKLQSGLDDDVEIHSVRLYETEENRES